MQRLRMVAWLGLLVAVVALPGCGGGKKERPIEPAPPGFENFQIPEERANEKGGFKKTFPKSPSKPR